MNTSRVPQLIRTSKAKDTFSHCPSSWDMQDRFLLVFLLKISACSQSLIHVF